MRTASPQSLDVKCGEHIDVGDDNRHFAEGKLSRPNWSCEASTLRSGYRIRIPHRQPQLEVTSLPAGRGVARLVYPAAGGVGEPRTGADLPALLRKSVAGGAVSH